jgi:hypothetical protein
VRVRVVVVVVMAVVAVVVVVAAGAEKSSDIRSGSCSLGLDCKIHWK